MRPQRVLTFGPVAALVATTGGCSSPGRAVQPVLADAAAPAASHPADDAAPDDAGMPVDGGGDGSDGQVAPLKRGPAPSTADAKFPFPQNRESSRCTYPSRYDNGDVVAAYQQWKADTVTSSGADGFLRVQRPNEPGLAPNSTVSEGIGYGMLIAVYMNDQDLFDNLWKYEQHWIDASGLMNWYIAADGGGLGPNGSGAATDADEDMAFGLVMADRQWGGQGSLGMPYAQYALRQIQDIWKAEIQDSKLPKPGEWGGWSTVNVSYFAPA